MLTFVRWNWGAEYQSQNFQQSNSVHLTSNRMNNTDPCPEQNYVLMQWVSNIWLWLGIGKSQQCALYNTECLYEVWSKIFLKHTYKELCYFPFYFISKNSCDDLLDWFYTCLWITAFSLRTTAWSSLWSGLMGTLAKRYRVQGGITQRRQTVWIWVLIILSQHWIPSILPLIG